VISVSILRNYEKGKKIIKEGNNKHKSRIKGNSKKKKK
jgi:hypothetical protein